MAGRVQRVYRRWRFGEPVIVVSGLPRSGTSMASRMLEAGGMTIVQDGIRTADEDNPRGYYEDERVKNLAESTDRSWLTAARGKVIKVISYLLSSLPANHNYRVLFMKRDLREVVASQNKMLDRRGEPHQTGDDKMIDLFEDHLWKVRYMFKHEPRFEVFELPYKDVVERPREQAIRMRDFVGRPLDLERMAAVVEKELYRNRR